MKRWFVALVVVGFALTGCSKSSDSKAGSTDGSAKSGDAAARSTLVKFLQETVSDKMTDKQAGCWADALIKDVGAKDALTVASKDAEQQLSEEVQTAASVALTDCVEPWDFISMSAAAQGQELTKDQVACLKDGFDDKTVAEFKKSVASGGPSALTEALVKKCTQAG